MAQALCDATTAGVLSLMAAGLHATLTALPQVQTLVDLRDSVTAAIALLTSSSV
jgi:hypothetical protein